MSRRNWLHFLALGLIVVLTLTLAGVAAWYSLPERPEVPGDVAAEGPRSDYPAKGSRCDPEILRDASGTPEGKAEAYRCADEAEAHRQQQQAIREASRASDAAEGQLVIAQAQARSSLVQTLVTILAFGAAALAVIYAKRAAADGERSADIAERSFESLERPYLVFEVVSSDIQIDGRTISWGDVIYRLRNFGRTPAVLTRKHFVMLASDGLPDPVDPLGAEGEDIVFGHVVGHDRASDEFPVGKAVPLISHFSAARKGVRRGTDIFLLGYVRYRDLAGSEFATGFCLLLMDGKFRLVSPADPRGGSDLYNYDRKLTDKELARAKR